MLEKNAVIHSKIASAKKVNKFNLQCTEFWVLSNSELKTHHPKLHI